MATATAFEKGGGRVEELGLLFEYTLKFLILAGFLELVLYRLLSRLGMHLSKVAAKYEAVRLLFKGLSSIGFALLNIVALLVFLAITLILIEKTREVGKRAFEASVIPAMSLLLLLTAAFLIFPPGMLGAILYNLAVCVVLAILSVEYLRTHRSWAQRVMLACFLLGVFGWLYYQTVSTAYGLLGLVSVPPLVHEANRAGEAMMVLASMLVLPAYGGISLRTKNKRQRRRFAVFVLAWGLAFLSLLFLDYWLSLYDKQLADSIRKASEGIGWIFQMGMGYTFYLPFALYVAGLFCWGYTIVKLILMGRAAGYGLALMFMAGYALQLSHLTLMVVLGVMLLTLDRKRVGVQQGQPAEEGALARSVGSLVGKQIVGEQVAR